MICFPTHTTHLLQTPRRRLLLAYYQSNIIKLSTIRPASREPGDGKVDKIVFWWELTRESSTFRVQSVTRDACSAADSAYFWEMAQPNFQILAFTPCLKSRATTVTDTADPPGYATNGAVNKARNWSNKTS